jgi:hypothetical protein
MKKYLYIVLLVAIGLFSLFKYYQSWRLEINNSEKLVPFIGTSFLSDAQVGTAYSHEIIGSVIGSSRANLYINLIDSPANFEINSCKTIKNDKLLPKPNSVIRCTLKAILDSEEKYVLKFEIGADGYSNKTITSLPLVLSN